MKIHEVETMVGITKRNIRFYEKEGLLSPGRNSDNGYREYSETDVEHLLQIKLLRKLDVPMEEIRRMQTGTLTLTDGVRRHIIQLERRQRNLEAMQTICQELTSESGQLSALDTRHYLEHMEQLEQEGTHFVNIKKQDTFSRCLGAVIAAAVFSALMGAAMALIFWALRTDPTNAPPPVLSAILLAIPAAAIIGVLLALWQRIKQIQGGEEDAASQY